MLDSNVDNKRNSKYSNINVKIQAVLHLNKYHVETDNAKNIRNISLVKKSEAHIHSNGLINIHTNDHSIPSRIYLFYLQRVELIIIA